jgi:hypothetical protein
MKRTYKHLIITALVSGVSLPAAWSQAGGHVSNPAKRIEAISLAEQLLEPRTVALPAEIKNPFHPGARAVRRTEDLTSPVVIPRIAGILERLANAIKPSGYFIIGGEPTLVFGQKRVNAGGSLTVLYEGAEYILEVTAIDRTSFTLRYNTEEYTRPIK